jgi:hypothetical protein
MTQPISAEVKERVVQQHIAGLGRNIISKRTGLSRGSVTNILKAYKCSTAKFTGLGYPKTGHVPEAIQTPTVTLETSQLSHESLFPYTGRYERCGNAGSSLRASVSRSSGSAGHLPLIGIWIRVGQGYLKRSRKLKDRDAMSFF